MQKLLELENLGKRYKDFTLRGINLSLEPGRVTGLVGSNGAGKTTIMKAALGIIAPDEGTVRLLGEEVRLDSPTLDQLKQRVGVVFDTCAFPNECQVRDVGTMGKASFPTWDPALWRTLIERFGLTPKKKVSELSRGMGMKLTLAFALAHKPDVLLLDEATAGLDPLAREEVLGMLRDFMASEDRGILMATHITTDLEKIADTIICIDAGQLVFEASRETITDEAGIARCRAAELEAVRESGMLAAGSAYLMRGNYGTDLLVPDRFAFARAFPGITVDRATIEEYMTLRLRGELL